MGTKNRFAVGDTLEISHPNSTRLVELKEMRDLDDEPIEVAAGNPLRVRIPLVGPGKGR